jgi:hypothetical protein
MFHGILLLVDKEFVDDLIRGGVVQMRHRVRPSFLFRTNATPPN